MTKIKINYIDNDDKNFEFIKIYIDNILDLIKDEIIYYIKPEMTKNYFEMINNQLINGKVNYILLKYLYAKMIELIIDKCIQANENDSNDNGQKYYEEAFKYIKTYMSKYLINRKEIQNEIMKKKLNKNINIIFNWME